MKPLVLSRFAYSPYGTFGKLPLTPNLYLFTVERPWLRNERNVSCIPIGTYDIILGMFYRNTADTSDDYPVYEVLGVPGRSLVKIHIANTPSDVKGCIGLGTTLGFIKSQWAVAHSRTALKDFMTHMEGVEKTQLVIENLEAGVLK